MMCTPEEESKWKEQYAEKNDDAKKKRSRKPREKRGFLNPPCVERELKREYKRARSSTVKRKKITRREKSKKTKKAKKTKVEAAAFVVTVPNEPTPSEVLRVTIENEPVVAPILTVSVDTTGRTAGATAGTTAACGEDDDDDDVPPPLISADDENENESDAVGNFAPVYSNDFAGVIANINATENAKKSEHTCASCNGVGECLQVHVVAGNDGREITLTTKSEHLPEDDGSLEDEIEEAKKTFHAPSVTEKRDDQKNASVQDVD